MVVLEELDHFREHVNKTVKNDEALRDLLAIITKVSEIINHHHDKKGFVGGCDLTFLDMFKSYRTDMLELHRSILLTQRKMSMISDKNVLLER